MALFTAVRVNPRFDGDSARLLADARRAWQIDHGVLPVVEAPLLLQRGEVAYGHRLAEALETRTRTRSLGYAGPSFRVKLAPGFYYQAGAARGAVREDYTHSFGRGGLVVTNKRLLFASPQKSITVRLSNIIDIEPYRDGVTIVRGAGKPVTFAFGEDDPWFSRVLFRVRSEV